MEIYFIDCYAQGRTMRHLRRQFRKRSTFYIRGTKTEVSDHYILLFRQMKNVRTQQKEYLKSIGVISPYFFPDKNGNKMTSNHLGRTWQAYRQQHGLKSILHESRHAFISISKSERITQNDCRAYRQYRYIWYLWP